MIGQDRPDLLFEKLHCLRRCCGRRRLGPYRGGESQGSNSTENGETAVRLHNLVFSVSSGGDVHGGGDQRVGLRQERH